MSLYKRLCQYLAVLGVLGTLSACGPEAVQQLSNDPIAFGRINQLNVIADSTLWEGPMGDTVKYYYMAPYPILPQPEPIFDVRQFSMEDLRRDPLRKELRHYLVVADLSDRYSETAAMVREDIGEEKIRAALTDKGYGTTVGQNKWAKGQLLIYVYAMSEEKLREGIVSSYQAIAKRLHKADEEMIEATAYFSGENRSLSEEVRAKMDVDIRIPEEFIAAINSDSIIWLRRETSEVSSNILLQRVPYTDQKQLSYEGIKSIRDSIGRAYISSTIPDTYMRINDVDLPMFVDITNVNGDYAIEARGVWDIVNDYMGGAFVSYLIHDPAKRDLLFIDAFVHAPGTEKRDIMQQLEFILHTARY